MQGLEIVNVRLADGKVLEEAVAFCREVLASGVSGRIHLYRGIGPGTDLGVHLHWTNGPFSQEKSLLGLHLARGLSKYGLVSHTLWMEEQKIPAGNDSRHA